MPTSVQIGVIFLTLVNMDRNPKKLVLNSTDET